MFHSVDDYYCHVYLFSSLTRESGLEARAVFATETPLNLGGGGSWRSVVHTQPESGGF